MTNKVSLAITMVALPTIAMTFAACGKTLPADSPARWLTARNSDVADAYYLARSGRMPERLEDCDAHNTTGQHNAALCQIRFALSGMAEEFEPFEARLLSAFSKNDLLTKLDSLPEERTLSNGQTFAERRLFREATLAIQPSIHVESSRGLNRFLNFWNNHGEAITERMESRQYVGTRAPVSVVVVERAPSPGLFAQDGEFRGSMTTLASDTCFLAENVVHEAIRQRNAIAGSQNVYVRLEAALRAQGTDDHDVETAINALSFVFAEDLIRNTAPCVRYQSAASFFHFFEQAGPLAVRIRDAFTPFVRGEIDETEALRRAQGNGASAAQPTAPESAHGSL